MKLLVVFVYFLHYAILINTKQLRQEEPDEPGDDGGSADGAGGPPTTSITPTDAGAGGGAGGGDEDINAKIKHLLEISKTGHYIGNHEFDVSWHELRQVSILGPEAGQLKLFAYDKFASFNALRLKLECDLEKRIAVIESYLDDKKISARCREFYRTQKEALKRALTASNSEKEIALLLHSEKCPKKDNDDDDDDDDEYDWDDCFDWTAWWN